jgi:hypothetical protein
MLVLGALAGLACSATAQRGATQLARPGALGATGPPRLSLISYGPGTAAAARTVKSLGPMFVDVGAEISPRVIRSMRRAAPRARVLTYFSVVTARPHVNDATGQCLAWRRGAPRGGVPLGEFLHTASGRPMTSGGELLLDFGVPAVQRACAKAMVAQAVRQGAQGIFLDSVNAQLFPDPGPGNGAGLCPGGSATCRSQAAVQRAWTRFMKVAAARLHAAGFMLIPNISFGSDLCADTTEDCWRAWSRIADGAMDESFVFGAQDEAHAGCARPVVREPPSAILTELSDFAWSERNGRYAIASSDIPVGDGRDLRYSVGIMLLVAGPHISWVASQGCYSDAARAVHSVLGSWAWSQALALGLPRAAVTVTREGLLVRRFARGSVAVNLTASSITSAAVGRIAAGGIHLG